MKKISFNQGALWFALLMALIAIGAWIAGSLNITGICLILTCLALSYGVKVFQPTKGLSFTMWILASVCIAMFFPQYFTVWGSFKLNSLVTPLLQIIMFGMGAQMSLNDFAGVMKRPGTVAAGVIGRFTIGPLLALALIAIFKPLMPAMDAATQGLIIGGIFLVAVLPCGLASNVMNMLANANLALAVTIGATTTLLAPFTVPFLMKLFASDYVPDLNIWKMMFDIFKMVIFPIIAGFVFNMFNLNKEGLKAKITQLSSFLAVIVFASLLGLKAPGDFVYFKQVAIFISIFLIAPAVVGYLLNLQFKGDQKLVKVVLGKLSQFGIFTIVLVITAAGQKELMAAGGVLVTLVILHNVLGYGCGYGLGWVCRLNETDRRTFAFEVGMPNAGLGTGLAVAFGSVAGVIGLASAIYGPVMNIFGSTLASIWKGIPPKELRIKN